MTIDRLRKALSAIGPPPDARELSEMLWLACHLSPQEKRPPIAPSEVREPFGGDAGRPPAPWDARSAPEGAPAAPDLAPLPLVPLLPPPSPPRMPDVEPVGEAVEVLVPTAPMLANPLGVQRALRPLKRRVPSRHRFELDEDATAARVADTGLWTPVLVSAPERWLTLSLVVDTGPTMRLWRPLARELTEVLLRQGAFQDVHLSHLDTTGRITSAPGSPPRDPATLLGGSGRHAVLVLSDCSGPHWWDGRAARAVRRWARIGPTAILQPLAERLWRRTAAPAVPGVAALPRPAAPNTDLSFTPYDGPSATGVPVPVLEVAPRWFGAWARLISGSGPQPAAVASFPARPSGAAPLRRERELPIAERVRRFLASASPAAAELAAHVAVSVPSLPVMRLIQHRVLGGSGPGQLAEVLLSGLLRPVGGVRYEFVPGAREALLDTLPRPEALHTRHVLEAVSTEIERRAGTSTDLFRALIPADGGPVTLTADTDHFALVTPETRAHLAPPPLSAIPDLPTGMDDRLMLADAGPPPSGRPSATNVDVLGLNGVGPGQTFSDAWSLPPSMPRDPAIGHDPEGNVVSLYPLDLSSGIPHGLIVGETEARQRAVRAIVLALAGGHAPWDLTFAFAGLGEHPLGEPLALPHVRYSEDELLGHPDSLRQFIEYLSDTVASRSTSETQPRLLLVVDLSLTFPSSRREIGEALLTLAQRGRSLGVQLLLSSATVEDTTMWNRFLPLLGWRITASRLPPAELRRVLGQAALPFPDERTAYLLAGGGAPRRFRVALEPPREVVDDFVTWVRRFGLPGKPSLPLRLHADALPAASGGRIPIGFEVDTLKPVFVDFDWDPHLLVTGRNGSGRANLLRLLIEGITAGSDRSFVYVLDSFGIIWTLAEEFGFPEPVGPRVTYTDSPSDFVGILGSLVAISPSSNTDVYLFVIDRDVGLESLSLALRSMLGRGAHLILAGHLTFPDQRMDPLVPILHQRGSSAVLLGSIESEEARLYQAAPAPSPAPVGRGVLVQGGRRRVIQVAHTAPRA
ncbi:hypothetical protein BZB76_4752 [Actinomadura pelletieri DSM 43383]|uniref:FtsK/SpoIIIE family protein n=1 Tax=Actinomadura pelletieri DSM 43383 TaxID=1120940 RepID=A0A495QII1_9ACTN|nr:SAV_2336 N-terminal domain-related protein [Actinomadura pelletieri]RKS71941.1 hypothetical protein BZB76_4752 [Actinomadura pelletieri DSM 43383]